VPEAVARQSDAALAAAILTALRLVEGRLQVVRRARVPAGAAAGAAVEAEQAVLQALCDAGPLPLPRLAERLGRPLSGVRVVVASLAERELVHAGPSRGGPPGGPIISITRAGRQASHRSVDRETATIEHAVANWPRGESQRLAESLTNLARALAGERGGRDSGTPCRNDGMAPSR
jgi:hypothetical protein